MKALDTWKNELAARKMATLLAAIA